MRAFYTHYDNLKVARDAPDIVIRAAYKSLSQKYHPDKNPGDERAARIMSLLNESYDVLSDPAKRRAHDLWILRKEAELEARKAEDSAAVHPSSQPSSQQQASSPSPRPTPRAPQSSSQTERRGRNILAVALLWPLKLLLKIVVAVPRLAFLSLLFGGFYLYSILAPETPPPPGPKPYVAAPAAEVPARASTPPVKPAYVRAAFAPNNQPWPVTAGYVGGYSILAAEGLSEVTIDNSQNNSDVFVKLVSLSGSTAFPVRQIFIPANSSFTLKNVSAGSYDLRYRDLDSGRLSRSESFLVEQTPTEDGTQYSSITMTLYKVQNGNVQTYDLAENEF